MGNGRFFDDVAKDWILRDDLNAPTPQKPSAAARDTAGAQMPQSAIGCCGPKAVVANYPGCVEGCAVCQGQQAANETSAWLISKGLPRDLEKHRWAPMRRCESVLCPMTEWSLAVSQVITCTSVDQQCSRYWHAESPLLHGMSGCTYCHNAGVHAQDPCVGLPRTGDGTYGTGHLHSQQQRARWKQEQHVAHGGVCAVHSVFARTSGAQRR